MLLQSLLAQLNVNNQWRFQDFTEEGAPTPEGLTDFSRKEHENKEILVQKGGG